ncbi:hypothetical protein I4641_20865 [Waterburya agarophytonicola K14]|uniref:DUF5648 domain-containing protein n=1 Tax=Waterburya agarophytonicola KI4 TaxID=2874699 RepID=A0A964BXF2_9CYAN|nr:hypothetical protein [Waterburya agarophytonicola]MCC0179417.1 hypothetical protein [Waterburya agarophytonicola KI4]
MEQDNLLFSLDPLNEQLSVSIDSAESTGSLVTISGSAAPDLEIDLAVISFGSFNDILTTTPDSDGNWSVQIPETLADNEYTLIVTQFDRTDSILLSDDQEILTVENGNLSLTDNNDSDIVEELPDNEDAGNGVEELPDNEDGGNGVEELPDSEDNGDITGDAVYRFFNNNSGVHFYTANETERDAIQELDNFNFEGASYSSVDPLSGQPEPVPVYRFLNQDTGVHLYTVSDIERDAVQELDNFNFEGEAFFAYESEVDGSIPIYRFFNNTSGAHFYTPSAGERDSVEANLPEFALEGIAYYALPFEE